MTMYELLSSNSQVDHAAIMYDVNAFTAHGAWYVHSMVVDRQGRLHVLLERRHD